MVLLPVRPQGFEPRPDWLRASDAAVTPRSHKKTRCHATPGIAVEPAMHPMSAAKRIQTQRIDLAAGEFTAIKPIEFRVLLCGLRIHQISKAQVVVLSSVNHHLADSELDAGRTERFALHGKRAAK